MEAAEEVPSTLMPHHEDSTSHTSITKRLRIRKDQSTLTVGEKKSFVNAVLALKRKPSQMFPPSQNRYDDYVMMHAMAMIDMEASHHSSVQAHRGPAFLPWHREYIRRFELDLQAIDQRVTLPYWDWTVDNTETSSIWNSDFMGGNGRSSDGRVLDGPFAYDAGNWNLNIIDLEDPNPGPDLRRKFGTFPNVSTLPTSEQVADTLKTIPYDSPPWNGDRNTQPSFRNRLEGWYGAGNIHNRVHLWVAGGSNEDGSDWGTMLWSTSPNDPVFFLHHCNIDRLWAEWQRQQPTYGYVPNLGGPTGQNVTDPLYPWGGRTTIGSVLDYNSLGYIYDKEIRPMHMDVELRKDRKAHSPFIWDEIKEKI